MGTKGNVAMNERWLSLAEIAAYLGVSKDSVYRWLELSAMPAHKVGRQWKFKATEADAWVRSGKALDFSRRSRSGPEGDGSAPRADTQGQGSCHDERPLEDPRRPPSSSTSARRPWTYVRAGLPDH